jgi:Putative peptidoglycan binding domain
MHTKTSLIGLALLTAIVPAAAFAQTYVGSAVNIGTASGIPVAASGGASVGGSTGSSVSTSGNQTAAQVAAQAQALIAEVQALEAQIKNGGGSVGTTGSIGTPSGNVCPSIGRTLSPGSSGTDVSRLQQYLALDPNIYPSPVVSGYYGSLTQAAVQRWQTKFNIVTSGSPGTTGFGVVGPRTAAAIAIVCGGGSYNGIR